MVIVNTHSLTSSHEEERGEITSLGSHPLSLIIVNTNTHLAVVPPTKRFLKSISKCCTRTQTRSKTSEISDWILLLLVSCSRFHCRFRFQMNCLKFYELQPNIEDILLYCSSRLGITDTLIIITMIYIIYDS